MIEGEFMLNILNTNKNSYAFMQNRNACLKYCIKEPSKHLKAMLISDPEAPNRAKLGEAHLLWVTRS